MTNQPIATDSFCIKSYRDYHEISGREINPEDYGFWYVGDKGFLRYYEVKVIQGKFPSKRAIKERFGKRARKDGWKLFKIN
jgi:hypothetical protein